MYTMYIPKKIVTNATNARKKFFDYLELASQGEEIIIQKLDEDQEFLLTLHSDPRLNLIQELWYVFKRRLS